LFREGGGAELGGAEAIVVGQEALAEHGEGGEGGGDEGDGGGFAEEADEGPEEEVEGAEGGMVEEGVGEGEGEEEVKGPEEEEEVAEAGGLAFFSSRGGRDEGAGDAGVRFIRVPCSMFSVGCWMFVLN
jgi:hypothetical protein